MPQKFEVVPRECILGDPGATSRDDAIFLARKFISRAEEPLGTFPHQTSSRSGRNPSAYWPEKFFSGQSRRKSSRIILWPSYIKWFSSSIDLVAWPVQREDFREEFQNKDLTKKRKSQTVPWELKIQARSNTDLSKVYRKFV